MTRLRLAAFLLASLVLALPFEHDSARAERSEPNYGPPSKTFKRASPTRPRRKARGTKPVRTTPAPARQSAAKAGKHSTPAVAPLPSLNPAREAPAAPVPQAKPETVDVPNQGEEIPPPPLPSPKPSEPGGRTDIDKTPLGDAEGEPPPPIRIPPQRQTTPADELACRERLNSLGAEFIDQPAQSDPSGCSLPYPLLLTTLSTTITVKPGALVNCATAEATARFAQGPMAEAARTSMGEELVSLDQASAYVCRPRHGTQKLSEHAFGNAIDLSRFTFSKGAVLDVGPVPGPAGEAFLRAVRKAACGPFRTVLGPGSDADHARHLHLDLAQRRHGGTFCQ